jgi:hypothetical protein
MFCVWKYKTAVSTIVIGDLCSTLLMNITMGCLKITFPYMYVLRCSVSWFLPHTKDRINKLSCGIYSICEWSSHRCYNVVKRLSSWWIRFISSFLFYFFYIKKFYFVNLSVNLFKFQPEHCDMTRKATIQQVKYRHFCLSALQSIVRMYSFFGVIPRRLNFMYRRFGTHFLVHLHRSCEQEEFTRPMKMKQSVPKRRHIKFRGGRMT